MCEYVCIREGKRRGLTDNALRRCKVWREKIKYTENLGHRVIVTYYSYWWRPNLA